MRKKRANNHLDEDLDVKLKITDFNCRLCNKMLKEKDGEWIYEEEIAQFTPLGMQCNLLLDSENTETECLSNRVCKNCCKKIRLCFNLLIEIRISDAVMRQVVSNSDDSNKDVSTSTFKCQQCQQYLVGMPNFIKHYEEHLLNPATDMEQVEFEVTDNQEEEEQQEMVEEIEEYKETDEEQEEEEKRNTRRVAKRAKQTLSNMRDEEWDNIQDESTKKNLKILKYFNGFDEVERETLISDLNVVEDEVEVTSEDEFITQVVEGELTRASDTDEDEVFQNHVIVQHNDRYYCPYTSCQESFEFKFSLRWHLYSHASRRSEDVKPNVLDDLNQFVICDYCRETFSTSEYKQHVVVCRSEFEQTVEYLCDVCGVVQHDFTSYVKHKKSHNGKAGWKCNVCGKVFALKTVLKNHMLEHDDRVKAECEVCGKKMLPWSLRKHLLAHKERGRMCHMCGRSFKLIAAFNNHMLTHHSDENSPKKCYLCEMEFDDLEQCQTHLTEVHNVKKKIRTSAKTKVSCEHCFEKFSSKLAYKNHLSDVHGIVVKEFYCEECQKEFLDIVELKAHLQLIHEVNDESLTSLRHGPVYRRVKCDLCGEVMRSLNSLQNHMRTQHGYKNSEMPFLKKECEKCGKFYATKISLMNHIKSVHLGLKPLACKTCGQTFSKHGSLIVHMYTHSGAKYFECEVCSRSYRQRNDALRHLARHVRDGHCTLEEAACRNNNEAKTVQKRRLFLKDSWLASKIMEEQRIQSRPIVSRIIRTNESGEISSVIFSSGQVGVEEEQIEQEIEQASFSSE